MIEKDEDLLVQLLKFILQKKIYLLNIYVTSIIQLAPLRSPYKNPVMIFYAHSEAFEM